MYAESFRPTSLNDVIGHHEIKQSLKEYLESADYKGSIFLVGPPGIGKTTLALCSAQSFGYDPLEINASSSIRSFEDVDKLKDSCRGSINIHSFIVGNLQKKTCLILDEIDGSDPHAQNKIVDWIKDPTRKIPIICTGNELPTIFKRNSEIIQILRCFPPNSKDIEHLFPNVDVPLILKECQHDIRRVFHKLQYGESYQIPKYILPSTGTNIERAFTEIQKMFDLPDPLEYLFGKQDNEHLTKTKSEYKSYGMCDHTLVIDIRQKKSNPDKLNKRLVKKKDLIE
jgi:replication-associated recombination protein RarA